MGRLFGTDGVRGVANRELTAELALALGSAAARHLASTPATGRRVAVIGRDRRASGEMLEAAVIAGLTSLGVDALRVGVLPTPAVAYLTGAYDADFGVMISASHNPMPDNGIKIFGPGGHKLDVLVGGTRNRHSVFNRHTQSFCHAVKNGVARSLLHPVETVSFHHVMPSVDP